MLVSEDFRATDMRSAVVGLLSSGYTCLFVLHSPVCVSFTALYHSIESRRWKSYIHLSVYTEMLRDSRVSTHAYIVPFKKLLSFVFDDTILKKDI